MDDSDDYRPVYQREEHWVLPIPKHVPIFWEQILNELKELNA